MSYHHEFPVVSGFPLERDPICPTLNPLENTLCNNDVLYANIPPKRQDLTHDGFCKSVGASMSFNNEHILMFHKFTSWQEAEDLQKKRSIKNGDYIRISNDMLYLTAYQDFTMKNNQIFFEYFSSLEYGEYSKLYTVF